LVLVSRPQCQGLALGLEFFKKASTTTLGYGHTDTYQGNHRPTHALYILLQHVQQTTVSISRTTDAVAVAVVTHADVVSRAISSDVNKDLSHKAKAKD